MVRLARNGALRDDSCTSEWIVGHPDIGSNRRSEKCEYSWAVTDAHASFVSKTAEFGRSKSTVL